MPYIYWKTRFTTLNLMFACATISAVLAAGCSTGEKGAKYFSRCIRIDANGSAVFADDGTWLATLNGKDQWWNRLFPTSEAILVCAADDGHELLKLKKPGQIFCQVFAVKGDDQLVSLSLDREQGPRGKLELNYWDRTTGTPIRSATLNPDFGFRGENRFVLSPGGERLYLVSQLSPVQRKRMPSQLQSADTLTCWELPSGVKKFVIQDDVAPQPRLSSLVFTGDRSIMAAICEPQMIVAWDAVTGKELHRFTDVDAQELAVNVDGTVLAVATTGKVRCWNLRTGKEAASVNVNLPKSKRRGSSQGDTEKPVGPRIVLSSDGRHLAVRLGLSIETWDVGKGERIRREELDANEAGAGIADMAFSPDGTLLAAVGREFLGEGLVRGYKGHLYVWAVASGQHIRHSTFDGGRGPHRLVFRGDGQRLMVVSEQEVNLCHLAVESP